MRISIQKFLRNFEKFSRRRFVLTMPPRPSRKADATGALDLSTAGIAATSPLKAKQPEQPRTKPAGSSVYVLDSEEVSPCCSGVISPILYDIPENVYEWSIDEVRQKKGKSIEIFPENRSNFANFLQNYEIFLKIEQIFGEIFQIFEFFSENRSNF